MKSWKTTLVGITAGILFILTVIALVYDKIILTEFAAINSGIASMAVTVLGILGKDRNATHSDYYNKEK